MSGGVCCSPSCLTIACYPSCLSLSQSIRSVHSKRSLQKVIDREKTIVTTVRRPSRPSGSAPHSPIVPVTTTNRCLPLMRHQLQRLLHLSLLLYVQHLLHCDAIAHSNSLCMCVNLSLFVFQVDESGGARVRKDDVSNLPYMNRNPAI